MNLYTQENIKSRQISTQNDERILLPSGIWEARRQRADIVKVVKFENIPVSYVHCMYVCVPKRQLCCWYSIYAVSDKCTLCMAVLDREKIISQSVYSKEGLSMLCGDVISLVFLPNGNLLCHTSDKKQNEKPFLLGNMIPELRIWLVLSRLNFV